jgi:hypothetical protein
MVLAVIFVPSRVTISAGKLCFSAGWELALLFVLGALAA